MTLNTLYMMNIFQRHYNCRCIMFTTTPAIIEKCKELDIVTTTAEMNEYHLPYIGSMYQKAKELFPSTFYGYINVDILISTDIFGVLEYMKTLQQTQFPNKLVMSA